MSNNIKNSKSKEEDKLIKKLIGFGEIGFPIPIKSFTKPIYNLKDFKREKLNKILEVDNSKYSKIKQFGLANRITKYNYTLAGLFVIFSSIVDKSEKAKKVFLSKDILELYKEYKHNFKELSKKLPKLLGDIDSDLLDEIDDDKVELHDNNKILYSNVKNRSFVSYIKRNTKSPEIEFRYGGYVIQNKPELDYMVLQSPFAKVQFSVQKSSLLVMFMYLR